jgi:hypothetical protein
MTRRPSATRLFGIAKVFGVNIGAFFEGLE